MQVAVVKYNAGNIYSVMNALKRLGVEPLLTDDAQQLRQADRVLFPGQGEASGAMAYLREHGLDQVIRSLIQPVLGICIGQQLLCRHSEEGDVVVSRDSLYISYIASMCLLVLRPLLQPTTFSLIPLHCIRITSTQHSFIRKRVEVLVNVSLEIS